MYDVPDLVKVLTGVRRGGKSVLLTQVQDDLRTHVPAERIICLNFEFLGLAEIAHAEKLDRHVHSLVTDPTQLHYVFLDEVQEVDGFERAVNSLRASGNLSVFITGSNSHLLDGGLSTYLAGRYIETKVWPLSFAESLELRGISLDQASLDLVTDYLSWGGMPFRFSVDPALQRNYLRDVFNSVVLRDVVQRAGVRDVVGLEAIIDFTIDNMGRVMSPSSLAGYLASVGKTLSTDAVYAYLRALDASLLLNRVRRYDLRGKRVMSTLDKYYATDVGLLWSRRTGQGPGQGDLVENCVYVELVRRGFDVYVGVTGHTEIDFVAVKDQRPRYIQTAYLITGDNVVAREFGAFAPIRDNHPKYVISLDPFPQDHDGIRHLSLTQFLLDPPDDLR
ncbi:MAG: ATP-binding protein [Propionibacteriaceae bacterium]|nr:ATP-binding protein [Propionibacteriaceae bacterium]